MEASCHAKFWSTILRPRQWTQTDQARIGTCRSFHGGRRVRGGADVYALAESTDNKFAIAVLKDIADEERVHAGEFVRLPHHLAPDEAKLYKKGAKEVDELLSEIQK